MTDAGLPGNFSQAQSGNAVPGKDLDPCLDQGIFQVTVMIIFARHDEILGVNLDTVKMLPYNLYSVKIQSEVPYGTI